MIMIITITVIAGMLSGYTASARTPTDGLEDLTRNILVGMVGAFVGLQLIRGIYDPTEAGASAIALTIAAMSGAILLLFIVNRFRRA